jgi:hypothetical protein
MDRIDVRDLIEGRNDWCNIPDVLRAAFKILLEENQKQKENFAARLDEVYRYGSQRHEEITRTSDLRFETIEAGFGRMRGEMQDLGVRCLQRVNYNSSVIFC